MVYKTTIDQVIDVAIQCFGRANVTKKTIIDDNNLYDVCLRIGHLPNVTYSPREIRLSFDEDTGLHMDIDDVTWEFDKDSQDIISTSREYFTAIRDGRVRRRTTKFLGLVTLKKELIIEP